MRRAVVTGGAGFIGSWLVQRLLVEGWSVTVVDDLSTGSEENLRDACAAAGGREAELVVQDVREEAVPELLRRHAPDVVFHLAAQADVRRSLADPVLDAEVNVVGTLRVLEGARLAGCEKIVFASSGGTIYGECDEAALPVGESHPQRPVSPYGVSKKVAVDYLDVYRRWYGLRWTALALANVYGPRQDPHGEAGVVAIFCSRMLAGEKCTIYGTGEQTRDFVYVDDVADAFVRAATRGEGLVNIGTGVQTSVVTLHRMLAEIVGADSTPEFAPERPGELARSALDPGLASLALDWRPTTPLESGLRETVAWFRNRLGEQSPPES
ncbi:MAG: putative UDP-glucose 4-epimerase GalE1 [Acidimicrobiales bacterium]|nr:MAG: putative UDP-glucose 4-epimerase GalE1 [Acidimicrobiales bacterium]